MANSTYRFYSDAGHGWLAVRLAELKRLGIADKITPFSYQKGLTVYLEEDCDAPAFFNAKTEHGEEALILNRNHGSLSPIRSYEPYNSTLKQ